MAKFVHEIMNPELFAVRASEMCRPVLENLLHLHITAAPVVDDAGKPLGVVSLRDLVDAEPTDAIFTHMTAPSATVSRQADIEQAARALGDLGYHHLIAIDDDGVAVGFISVLDVLRALVGQPVTRPTGFPHFDTRTQMSWSNDTPLHSDTAAEVPQRPGLFVLTRIEVGQPDTTVWSEATSDLHHRLVALSQVTDAPPHLHDLLRAGKLVFRYAVAPSARALMETTERLRGR